MGKPVSEDDIVAWAESKTAPAESPSYKRLNDLERSAILQLADRGWTQSAIAKHLKRSVSTVHEVLQLYRPTVDLAKRKLRANAERMAENVIENGDPHVHVQALKGIGVLGEDAAPKVRFEIRGIVLAGMPSVNVMANYQTQTESERLTGQSVAGALEASFAGESDGRKSDAGGES